MIFVVCFCNKGKIVLFEKNWVHILMDEFFEWADKKETTLLKTPIYQALLIILMVTARMIVCSFGGFIHLAIFR